MPVVADVTITCNYKQQYYATITPGVGCSADLSTDWYDANTTITWTADANYAFDNSGKTTDTSTISSGTAYTKDCTHINVTSVSGINCSTEATTG